MDKGIIFVVTRELEWWGNYLRKLRVTSGLPQGRVNDIWGNFGVNY